MFNIAGPAMSEDRYMIFGCVPIDVDVADKDKEHIVPELGLEAGVEVPAGCMLCSKSDLL